jgi:uncharacterized protein (TIGR02145 family)
MKRQPFTVLSFITVMSLVVLMSFVLQQNTEVRIGKQIWSTRNLDIDRFRNGDPIPHAKTKEEWERADKKRQPAWCYYNNDPSYGKKYGKLYNWYAVADVRGLAPKGWHIPSDAEWIRLTDYLGGETEAGYSLKSNSGWQTNRSGTNESGFSALPGSLRISNGDFATTEGMMAFFWTATENENHTDDAWYRSLNIFNGKVLRFSDFKSNGKSVRCVKD